MKNVEKFKELTTILITKCLRLEARDVDKRTKQIERINETEQELIKMYEELEECADDNTQYCLFSFSNTCAETMGTSSGIVSKFSNG